VDDNLRMHSRYKEVVLILRSHLTLVRNSEEIELVIRRPDYRGTIRHEA
jgi:hypothetical protein